MRPGRLSPEESARFEAHFVDCAQCMDQLDTVERLRTADVRPGCCLRDIRSPGVVGGWLAAAAILLAAAASLFFAVRDASMRKVNWSGHGLPRWNGSTDSRL